MIRKSLAAALFLTAACSDRQPKEETATKQASAPSAEAKPKLVEEKNEVLEFTYGWPAEVEAIPTLKKRFEEDLATQRKQALATAQEDFEAHGKDGHHSHSYSRVWETYGSNPLLLSLASETGTFTGGVHGNTDYSSLLWYKSAARELKVEGLFGDSKRAFNLMTPGYCAELKRQQAEKREGSGVEPSATDIECKPLAEQVMVPVDENRDGKFDLLRVKIGPYGAGPYVEGAYEIDIPISPEVRRLLKPEFAAAF
jgi:hypothetical protein